MDRHIEILFMPPFKHGGWDNYGVSWINFADFFAPGRFVLPGL
jgi:hypothetical protein